MRFVNHLRRPGIVAAALGAVVLAGLLLADRPIFGAAIFESLDLAANSLLIGDAKHLALLNGNYSRVGFNHPGPAILYVLAAGELVFHDWLGWVRSPMAGQVVAIAFYSAAWIATLAWVLGRTFRSPWVGAAAVAVFVAVTLMRDHQYLVRGWFPHLYFMPFAVYTAALGRFAGGSLDTLVPACIAGGFLVHGHASFVAIAGLMAVGALVAHAYGSGELRRAGWRAYAREAWVRERRALLACVAIAAAFALPIVLDAVLHFPGEFPKYFSYGRGSRGNGWGAVLGFLSFSWGGSGNGVLPVLAGCAAIAVLALFRTARGLAVSLALATLATALYAKTGIDDLIHKYTVYFYFAAVALTAAGFVAVVLARFEATAKALPAVVAVVALGFALTRMEPSFIEQDPAIPAAAADLEKLERRPAVLDLEMGREWQHLWGFVVGVASYEARAGKRPLCVNANWHILFTRRLQCTDADRASGTRLFVAVRPEDRPPPGGRIEHSRVTFVPAVPPRLDRGTPLLYTEANAERVMFSLREGWWTPERDFTWSTSSSSTIEVRVDERGPFRLALEIGAFVPRAELPQRAEVRAAGRMLAAYDFTAERNVATRMLEIPAGIVGGDGVLRLEFRVDRPRSPQSVGYSPDARSLGVLLRSITLLPAPS